MNNKRDDFSTSVKETLKKRAAFICSNPNCKIMTIAPSIEDEEKVQYIGKVAHITAASKGGPRYDIELTEDERKAISNAIFLCSNCADMIDKNNGIDYKVKLLNDWKSNHENWTKENLNKRLIGVADNVYNTRSNNQSGGITANVVNVSSLNLNPNEKKDEHDLKIFKESNNILDENSLNQITHSLLADESIWSKNQDKLEKLRWFFEQTSNEYINENIQAKLILYTKSLNNVLLFLLNDFDMWPYNQPSVDNYKVCMRPELNIDRNGRNKPGDNLKHAELHSKLRDVVQEFEANFKTYRRSVKLELSE